MVLETGGKFLRGASLDIGKRVINSLHKKGVFAYVFGGDVEKLQKLERKPLID